MRTRTNARRRPEGRRAGRAPRLLRRSPRAAPGSSRSLYALHRFCSRPAQKTVRARISPRRPPSAARAARTGSQRVDAVGIGSRRRRMPAHSPFRRATKVHERMHPRLHWANTRAVGQPCCRAAFAKEPSSPQPASPRDRADHNDPKVTACLTFTCHRAAGYPERRKTEERWRPGDLPNSGLGVTLQQAFPPLFASRAGGYEYEASRAVGCCRSLPLAFASGATAQEFGPHQGTVAIRACGAAGATVDRPQPGTGESAQPHDNDGNSPSPSSVVSYM